MGLGKWCDKGKGKEKGDRKEGVSSEEGRGKRGVETERMRKEGRR